MSRIITQGGWIVLLNESSANYRLILRWRKDLYKFIQTN